MIALSKASWCDNGKSMKTQPSGYRRVTTRRNIVTTLVAFLPLAAWADPVNLTAGRVIAFPIVIVFALIVETGIVALLLAFSGMSPLRTLLGYSATNFAVFLFLFCPLTWWWSLPVPLAELLVVIADGACIKLLSNFEIFQGDDFDRVSWRRAALVSCIGNAVSFLVGVAASRSL